MYERYCNKALFYTRVKLMAPFNEESYIERSFRKGVLVIDTLNIQATPINIWVSANQSELALRV